MKLTLTFFVSLLAFALQDLSSVREQYSEATKSQKNAEDFYNLVANASKDNKVMLGYKGAAIALKAKFAKDRKAKKSLFIEGVKLIENAIKSEPNNIELRLIRLSIQENTPKILNYKSNINEDKKLILTNFGKQNQSLKEHITSFVKQSSVFSEMEKKSILN
ncbi:MAG: hypothetical protein JNJ52_00875 [Flavobacterium sp.]|nr:hypothetical protein [Flavobacterium sp.]